MPTDAEKAVETSIRLFEREWPRFPSDAAARGARRQDEEAVRRMSLIFSRGR